MVLRNIFRKRFRQTQVLDVKIGIRCLRAISVPNAFVRAVRGSILAENRE